MKAFRSDIGTGGWTRRSVTTLSNPLSPERPPVICWRDTKLVSTPGFAGPFTPSAQDLYAAWAPDGKSIIFTATDMRNQSAYAAVTTNLYQIDAAGSEPKRLTFGNHNYSKPVFRPDGKALYFESSRIARTVQPIPDRDARLAGDVRGKGRHFNFRSRVSSYAFTPDSRKLYSRQRMQRSRNCIRSRGWR